MKTGKTKAKKNVRIKRRRSSTSNHAGNLRELQHEELSGEKDETPSTATSSTDEGLEEGLGDGNIGRSKKNIFGK